MQYLLQVCILRARSRTILQRTWVVTFCSIDKLSQFAFQKAGGETVTTCPAKAQEEVSPNYNKQLSEAISWLKRR